MSWLLYSSPRSPFVRKVMIAAHELDLARRIERKDVVTTPMTPSAEVLAVNPTGMIPTLVVDGEVIFDSLVILEFLDQTAGGGLFPAGPARRDCQVRHAVANAMMDKAVRILDEQFRAQNKDTEEHLAGYIATQRRVIGWMAERLDATRFDAGDIAFAACLSYLDMRFPHILWRDGQKTAAEWYKTVAERPSMKATAFAVPSFV